MTKISRLNLYFFLKPNGNVFTWRNHSVHVLSQFKVCTKLDKTQRPNVFSFRSSPPNNSFVLMNATLTFVQLCNSRYCNRHSQISQIVCSRTLHWFVSNFYGLSQNLGLYLLCLLYTSRFKNIWNNLFYRRTNIN